MSRLKVMISTAAGVAAVSTLSLVLTPASPAAAAVNSYSYGQCTYFAKLERPDVGNHWGDARFWDNSARAAGFPVDGSPRVGDVVVFERGVQGNSPYGHVAIVSSVNGSQFTTVSMWGNERSGKIHVNTHHTGAGVSFIHRMGTATSSTKTAAKATATKAAVTKAATAKTTAAKAAATKAAAAKTAAVTAAKTSAGQAATAKMAAAKAAATKAATAKTAAVTAAKASASKATAAKTAADKAAAAKASASKATAAKIAADKAAAAKAAAAKAAATKAKTTKKK
ncbi:MAG: CHAP domain-containing protein [Chloroflexota bacterium]|nr:CHAP domain-containing protein [Chloroflexota bacterium]